MLCVASKEQSNLWPESASAKCHQNEINNTGHLREVKWERERSKICSCDRGKLAERIKGLWQLHMLQTEMKVLSVECVVFGLCRSKWKLVTVVLGWGKKVILHCSPRKKSHTVDCYAKTVATAAGGRFFHCDRLTNSNCRVVSPVNIFSQHQHQHQHQWCWDASSNFLLPFLFAGKKNFRPGRECK